MPLHRSFVLVALLACTHALPPASAHTLIASGDILVGHSGTSIVDLASTTKTNGVDSYWFSYDPEDGARITVEGASRSGLDYDLDVYFFTADWAYLGGCATAAPDESCEFHVFTKIVVVALYEGADVSFVAYTGTA
jgi:hypothetical protein